MHGRCRSIAWEAAVSRAREMLLGYQNDGVLAIRDAGIFYMAERRIAVLLRRCYFIWHHNIGLQKHGVSRAPSSRMGR